jgi:hypothetical protein
MRVRGGNVTGMRCGVGVPGDVYLRHSRVGCTNVILRVRWHDFIRTPIFRHYQKWSPFPIKAYSSGRILQIVFPPGERMVQWKQRVHFSSRPPVMERKQWFGSRHRWRPRNRRTLKFQMLNELFYGGKECPFVHCFLTIIRPFFGITSVTTSYHSATTQFLSTERYAYDTSTRIFFTDKSHRRMHRMIPNP